MSHPWRVFVLHVPVWKAEQLATTNEEKLVVGPFLYRWDLVLVSIEGDIVFLSREAENHFSGFMVEHVAG